METARRKRLFLFIFVYLNKNNDYFLSIRLFTNRFGAAGTGVYALHCVVQEALSCTQNYTKLERFFHLIFELVLFFFV